MLFGHCTRTSLEIEARNIYRLRSSPVHQNTLSKILDAFQYEQACRNVRQHRTFESRGRGKNLFRPHYEAVRNVPESSIISILIVFLMAYSRPILPATSIRQIMDVNPSSPGVLADLTYDFCLEWKSFSPQGEPL